MSSYVFATIFKYQAPDLRFGAEVQNKSQLQRCCPEIVQQLRLMRDDDGVGRLQFKENAAVYNHVGPEVPNTLATKEDWNRDFGLHLQAFLGKSNLECVTIHRLQESATKLL